MEFLKRFNCDLNIFSSWHSNPSNAGAKVAEYGCFIPLQIQGPVYWILSRWCRWRCVWAKKMGSYPTIRFPDSALDPWMGGGKLKDEPALHEWKSEPRLVKQNKTKIFRLRKPPAKLKRTAASAWKMFKPQIAKLDPICVTFWKQGQLNYNTLLSVFLFLFQICGLIFQQQCKPELIHRPCRCQGGRGSKFIRYMLDWVFTLSVDVEVL